MKQICIARNTDDVATLLGQCQRVMNTLRTTPDTEQIYTNTHMEGITGLDVLFSPTEVEIHTAGQDPFSITLMPDAKAIDTIVAATLTTEPGGTAAQPPTPKKPFE